MIVIRETVELLLDRLSSQALCGPAAEFEAIAAQCAADRAAPAWAALDALFRRLLEAACAEDPEQLYSAFRAAVDGCQSADPPKLEIAKAVEKEKTACELERQARELRNAKIALEGEIEYLAACKRDCEAQLKEAVQADRVTARSARAVADLLFLADGLNEELRTRE
jgi:hypothetical protein